MKNQRQKIRIAIFLISFMVLLVLFSGCSKTGDADKKATNTLARVFAPEMLKADLPYFENITGPARNTYKDKYGETKIYPIEGCKVTATVRNGSILSLRVDLSPKCTFDLSKFVGGSSGKLSSPHTMTFGQFDELIGAGQFMASCLRMCGNAADPVVYEHFEYGHVNSFLEVMPEVVLVGDEAIDASLIWEEAMIKEEGEDWVINRKFNCDTKYDAIAHKAFKNVRITAITIGYDIVSPLLLKN